MSDESNPAARLLTIFEKLRNGNREHAVRKVMADALGSTSDDAIEIYRRIFALVSLIDEVESEVALIAEADNPFKKYFPFVKRAILPDSLDLAWQQHIARFDSPVIPCLEFSKALLAATTPASKTASQIQVEDELGLIDKGIQTLKDTLTNTQMKEALRVVLLDLLESMHRAVAEYQIRGARGLRKELFSILERLHEKWDVIQKAEDPAEKSAVSNFMVIVGHLDHLTSLLLNINQILPMVPAFAEPFLKALSPGTSG